MIQTSFKLQILTPSLRMEESASMVILPGEEGVLGVLPLHMNLIVNLKAGLVEVHKIDGTIDKIYISKGLAQINATLCAIIANHSSLSNHNTEKSGISERIKFLQGIEREGRSSYILQDIDDEIEFLKVQV